MRQEVGNEEAGGTEKVSILQNAEMERGEKRMNDAASASRTATTMSAQVPWFRSSEAWAAHELIKLYQQEFGGDWKQFYAATVRIEVPRG